MDDATIKENLLRRRMELHLTQKEMAARLDISLNAYRKIETGGTRIINEHVRQFAASTGVSLSYLVNGFEPMDPAATSLEEEREQVRKQFLDREGELRREIALLRERIVRLEEKLSDKDALIEANRKLISHYEKELSERAK